LRAIVDVVSTDVLLGLDLAWLQKQKATLMTNVDLNTRLCDGHAVVALSGELDVTGSADAASAIEAAAERGQIVIVDVSALDFIDCGALAALLGAQRLARLADGEVLLATPTPAVRRLLMLTGMSDLLGVYATMDAAIASIGGRPERSAGRRPAMSTLPLNAASLRTEFG
jgi:anti-sigma B factor antagonist